MNEGAVTISESGGILYSNQSFARSMRTPIEKMIGVDFLYYIHSSNIIMFKHLLGRSINGPVRDEILFKAKDGTRIPMILSINFSTATGAPIYCIIASDLTERVLAEDALKKVNEKLENRVRERTRELSESEAALKESEQQFRSVLDSSRDAIYRLNLQTSRYEYISPAFQSVLGYSSKEWSSMSIEQTMALVHPDDLPGVDKALARLFEEGDVEYEYRLRDKSGEYRWISNNFSLVKDDSGRPLYRDGFVSNITARKNAEEALKRAKRSTAACSKRSGKRSTYVDWCMTSGVTSMTGSMMRSILPVSRCWAPRK